MSGFSVAGRPVAYPEEVWKGFGPKQEFADLIASLLERGMSILDERPSAHPFPASNERKAVVALTMGKDSLASLLLGKEMGFDLAAAYVYHPTKSDEFKVRLPRMEALGAHLSIPVHGVRDEALALIQNHPTGAVGSLRTAFYCLLLLPFANHAGARRLILGNGYEFNYPMGKALVSPLQSAAGTAKLDAWIQAWTGGAVGVASWIASLHPIACHKLVHAVRPDIGAFQVSCRKPPAGDNLRWCQDCATCAENYLYIVAMGRDPATMGFTKSLLDERGAAHLLFDADPADPYRYHAARQLRLAAHLARHIPILDDAERKALEDYYLHPVPSPDLAAAAAGRLLR
jgi:hypothetical protein